MAARITILYHMPVSRREGGAYCNGAFGRYVDEVAKHFAEVTLCAPVQVEPAETEDYRLEAENVRLCPLPFFDTFGQLLWRYPRVLYTIVRDFPRWELINLRIPSYYAFFVYLLAQLWRRRVFLLVVGDTRQFYDTLGFRGLKRLLARLWVGFLETTDAFMVRRSLTFVNGDGLFWKYHSRAPRICRTVTASIREAEILPTRLRPIWPNPIRLLYVGRLYPEKGLGVLLEALQSLRDDGVVARLTIVGQGKYRADLEARVRSLALEPWVEFLGHVPFGPLLFQAYRGSDIFVLPSLSEGLPRVLGEAMSQGLPVIATRVGGIPGIVRDGVTACLVTPGSPADLAAGVRRLLDDPGLARRLVTSGLAWAREHTVEKHVQAMLEIVGGTLLAEGFSPVRLNDAPSPLPAFRDKGETGQK